MPPLSLLQIDRLPSKERGEAVSGYIDFNSFGADFHTAKQLHEYDLGLGRDLRSSSLARTDRGAPRNRQRWEFENNELRTYCISIKPLSMSGH